MDYPMDMVIDADGLNVIAERPEVLREARGRVVVTPHPGEMSRLVGLTTAQIQADRIGVAQRFAAQYGVVTVLKGAATVTALPDGRTFINSTGNAGMATAGSGDVLTGIIGGLMAQGVDAGSAALAGPYLHGLAGDRASNLRGMTSMIAGDIIAALPEVLREWERH